VNKKEKPIREGKEGNRVHPMTLLDTPKDTFIKVEQ